MNRLFCDAVSLVLVVLGVLAELNLMRLFLNDAREARRERRVVRRIIANRRTCFPSRV